MNQLVITGGQGALARAVIETFTGSDWEITAPGRVDLDVTDPAAINRFFQDRQVDVLVCTAGITRDALLPRLTENSWDNVMSVNFHGASACSRSVLPGMIARRTGHLVFISSQSAIHPPSGHAAYAAAKAALLGLAADLARETGSHGIRVNTVLPGFLETPMTEMVTAARRREILAEHVLGHFNTASAVARFIHFLHHELPHTSGQIFQLDSRPAP